MKISELTSDRAVDVLCEITPFIANITGDKGLMDVLAKKFTTKGKSVAELYTFAANKYATIVPIVLKDHRADVFGLLAVLNETTVDKIAAQNILDTLGQVRDVFTDKQLVDFFKSWQQGEKTE